MNAKIMAKENRMVNFSSRQILKDYSVSPNGEPHSITNEGEG